MDQAQFDSIIEMSQPSERIGPWSDVLSLSKNYLAKPHLKKQLKKELPYQDEIIKRFTSMGQELRSLVLTIDDERDPKLKSFIKNKYFETLPLLRLMTNSENQEMLRAVFISNLANFTIKFSNNGGRNFKEILIRGDGTCWQQAVVARVIANNLIESECYWLGISSSSQFGHTLLLSPNAIIDVSNNVVILSDYISWNSIPKWLRLIKLFDTDYSYYGPSAMIAFGKDYLLVKTDMNVDDYYVDFLEKIPAINFKFGRLMLSILGSELFPFQNYSFNFKG